MHILFLGDSLTRSYDVPYGRGWVETEVAHCRGHRFHNAGTDGASLQALTLLWERCAQTGEGYDGVFVMGGTNDILQGRSAAVCLQKMTTLLELLKTAVGTDGLCVGIPLPIEGGLADEDEVMAEYGRSVTAYCEEQGILYIDFYTPLHEALAAGQGVYAGDVHPNQRGYDIMAETALPVLRSWLSRTGKR